MTVFSVVLLGDVNVGKTSLLARFISNSWDDEMTSTLGQTYLERVVPVGFQQITLRLWDTPGDKRFVEQNKLSYRSADCCVIVYDIVPGANNASFECVKPLINRYQAEAQSAAAFVVVAANKCDLVDETYQALELQKLEDWHGDFHLGSFVTSAKTGENVAQLFTTVAEFLLKRMSGKAVSQSINLTRKPTTESKCC
jgi:small GTP-binding protein